MESELFLSILSSMAEGESSSISENNKWAIQKRFKNGTFKISYPPYGYDWNGKQMVVNPEQAKIVEWIFSQILSGKGTLAVANELNKKGVPTKKGGRWTASTVRGMLANEKYTGDVIFKRPTQILSLIVIRTMEKEIAMPLPATTKPSSAVKILTLQPS